MEEVLIYISLIIGVSAIFTIIARIIKQPPIIAYLISGVVVGPVLLNLIGGSSPSQELLQTFSRIGVAFLLFIVGLKLDFRLFREIGKVSVISGTIEVVSISFLGFLLCLALGFNNISSLYLGIAFAFSSTVVVVKILSDKKEIDTLHGRISIGILIVQDILASIALMIVPLLKENKDFTLIFQQVGIAILLIVVVLVLAKFIFSRFMNYLARSQETLFLFGIAWALILASAFYRIGFSMEIGALIAGISLASSKYALDLEGKMKPLRDFFVILFFIFFGSQLTSVNMEIFKTAIILSLFVMIIKPLLVMYNLKILGYTKKTNFLTSMSLAQVSEFSLILILLGFSMGFLNQEIMNLAVLVSLITIGLSAYSMKYSHFLNDKLSKFLNFFDGKKYGPDNQKNRKDYDILLFGYHRIGFKLLETLKKMKKSFVVVDYNPKVVTELIKKEIDSLYGDAGNRNFLDELPIERAKLIISTIPEEQSNLMIKEKIEETKSEAVFIATAEQPRTALDLYKLGVDYVIIPHHLGGDYAASMIKDFGSDKEKYKKLGKEHKHNLEKSKSSSTFD